MKMQYVLMAGILCLLLGGCTLFQDEGAVLRYSSFEGGGPSYSIEAANPELITWESKKKNRGEGKGASYDVVITIKGLAPGETEITVKEQYDMREELNREHKYIVTVNEDLQVDIMASPKE